MAAEENVWMVMVGWNEHEKNLKYFWTVDNVSLQDYRDRN